MTFCLRRPKPSPAKQVPIQLLLYKTTNHMSNATSNHFFCLPNEKNLSKTTTTKLYPAKKWEKNKGSNA